MTGSKRAGVRIAATVAGLVLSSGCGTIPDIKVEIGQIAPDIAQVATLIWDQAPKVATDMPIFSIADSSGKAPSSYSFGMMLPSHDMAYLLTSAEFSSGGGDKRCLRGTGVAVQGKGFVSLSSITIVMPASEAPVSACYDKLDATIGPLVAGLSLQVNRYTESVPATVLLSITGWNFQPDATVKLEQVRGGMVIKDRTPAASAVTVSNPAEIGIALTTQDLLWLEDPTTMLHATVTNGDKKTSELTLGLFGQ